MVPIPTPLYHITHLENLPSILTKGGLGCPNQLAARQIGTRSIAYRSTQGRRKSTPVPCGPGGTVHDYVPFFFAPRPPMLFTIAHGNVEEVSDGQRAIIYLVTTAQAVQAAGRRFVFTDGHAIMEFTEFFDTLDRLEAVDWRVMRMNYWHDTERFPDRKRRRQAEFLVHSSCPWRLIQEVAVYDDQMRVRVEEEIAQVGHKPPVTVRRGWYY